MKIRPVSRLSVLDFWIYPAMITAMLWGLVWMIGEGLFAPSFLKRPAYERAASPQRHVSPFAQLHVVERDVKMGEYLSYIASLAAYYDRRRFYPIDEYVLARANPWLIDSLAGTDYYLRKARGEFVYDPAALTVLYRGELLRIPDSATVCALQDEIGHTLLDLNIPAYRLRVKIYGEVVHEIPVRVGRYQHKYLAMAGATVDLRTQTGQGKIVRINRDPDFINPSNNRPYDQTRRDDGRYTLLPGIPWLEPELDGRRRGQLIHPTTNIETLGRAYSNGCIGTSEADAWRLYYYAPLGARMLIRYDLVEEDASGVRVVYRDIYGRGA